MLEVESVLFVWELMGAYFLSLGILYHHRICMSHCVLPPPLLLSEKPRSRPYQLLPYLQVYRSTSVSLWLPLPPGQTEPCGTQLSSLTFANLSPFTTLWRPQALALGPLTTLDPCSIVHLTDILTPFSSKAQL